MSTFKQLRVLFLLLVLLLVAASAWLTKLRTTSWEKPLVVALYPLNGDGSARAADYIAGLGLDDFRDIESFFREEAAHYQLGIEQPFELVLGPTLAELPPVPPQGRNPLAVMWWSLKMRYWSHSVAKDYGPPAHIQMFVLYHDPAQATVLAHSLGLQKGLVGVVHAFADWRQAGSNNMVIAHELLHTVGASDKYDAQTNAPLYPIGYADPQQQPLLPQSLAEIMAGRIPLSENLFRQAESLNEVVIGEYTAREIHWLDE